MNWEYVSSLVPVINIGMATATLGVLIYVYLKHKKKPLIYWSTSWLFFILMQVAFYIGNKEGVAIFYVLFSGMVMSGTIRYLKEYEGISALSLPEIIGIVPFLFALYGLLLTHLRLPYGFLSSVEVPFVVLSGVVITLAGHIFMIMSRRHRDSLYLGTLTIAFGIFTLLYPVRMSFARFHCIWKFIATIVSLFAAFFIIRLVTSREFLFFEGPVEIKAPLKPGARLITSQEYERVKKELKEYPVLAFVRSLDVPERWNVYYLGADELEGHISPTNLAYLAQMTREYFREAKEKGASGVVVIDCLEYLSTYNGFESVVKFLATLVDFAVTNNGVLLVVLDEEAWNERQLAILRRVLG